jgi:acyl-CoA reductase-like NAD-dependent aldehyde dehydrogenase
MAILNKLNFWRKIMPLCKVYHPNDPATTLGPLASKKALNLLLDQIKLARKEGERLCLVAEGLTARASIWNRRYWPSIRRYQEFRLRP